MCQLIKKHTTNFVFGILTLICIIAFVAIFLAGPFSPDSASTASWFQAVGSIWAIFVAIWISARQAEIARNAQTAEIEDRRNKQQLILNFLLESAYKSLREFYDTLKLEQDNPGYREKIRHIDVSEYLEQLGLLFRNVALSAESDHDQTKAALEAQEALLVVRGNLTKMLVCESKFTLVAQQFTEVGSALNLIIDLAPSALRKDWLRIEVEETKPASVSPISDA